MKKILMVSSLMLFNLSLGFSKDFNISQSDIRLDNLGLEQGGKIQFTSDLIIPANEVRISAPGGSYCAFLLKEKKSFLRVIKKGTVFNVTDFKKAETDRVNYSPYDVVNFSLPGNEDAIKEIQCNKKEVLTPRQLSSTFDNIFKILVPEPANLKSAIKMPKNKKSNISADEVVQKLPQACVYIGMWKEKDQLPNLSENAKNYLATFIPILRGTFKSLNNIDCDSIPKEKLIEAAMKLSEDKNVNDNSRNITKAKKSSNSKAKGHSSKNM